MVVLEIYSRCLRIQYKAYLCSTATIFTLFTALASVIISFLFAYNSRGFWLKHDTFYEQPYIKFRGEFILSAVTQDIMSPILCSNFPLLQKYSNLDKCSLIQVREIDKNGDTKVDELEFNINILQEDSKVKSVFLLLTLDYYLKTCPTLMQAAIILQHALSEVSTEIHIVGNLVLSQAKPITCNVKYTNTHYNYSVISNENELESYNIKNIILNYVNRDLSTHLRDLYIVSNIDRTSSDLSLNLNIRYQDAFVYYIPGFLQIMKWAWIQYLVLYITFSWFIRIIRNYVFENRLILFYEQNPLKKFK